MNGEQAVAEDLQVEHRRARAALDRNPGGKQDEREEERDDDDRVVPAAQPAARDAENEAGQPEHEGDRAEHVISAHAVRFCELAQDEAAPGGAEQGERDVEPEDPVPGDRHERTAEDRSEHEADGRDHRVAAHRKAELLLGKGVGDEGGGVGEDERGTDPLEDAPEDEDRRIRREAGAEGGYGEQDEPAHVCALAPEQVAETPGAQHEDGRGDEIGEDHPDERQEARVERALEVGQGDDERAGIGGRKEHSEARAGERPPLVVLIAGGGAEAVSAGPDRSLVCGCVCGAHGCLCSDTN
jgi:hypothetical protein